VTKKEKARDSRLMRTYGISLDQFNERAKSQGNKCYICKVKKNAKGEVKSLHVDHWHAIAKVKVKAEKSGNGWRAYNVEFSRYGYSLPEKTIKTKWCPTRNKAVKIVKNKLKEMANRGIICWPCNSGIHRWDDLVKLERALKYLKKYFKKLKAGDYDFRH